MKDRSKFSGVRYVLIGRNEHGKRIATCGTPRSLVGLSPLHRSLFALHADVVSIDVVFPPVSAVGEKIDAMEPIVCANRADEPGMILWHRERDLREIEERAERDRQVELARVAAAAAMQEVARRDLEGEQEDQGEQGVQA